MCDPITLTLLAGSAAASFAGTGIAAGEAAKNNNRVAEARNKVLRDTNAKNLALGDKNRSAFAQRIAEMAPENTAAELQTAQDTRGNALEQAITPQAIEAPVAADAPQVIKSEFAKRLSDTMARSRGEAHTLGKIGGYGTQMQDQAIADAGLGRGINTNNNFVAGNARIMPSLQDYAEYRATKPSSGLGELIGALGQVAGQAAGARGMKKPAVPASAAAPDFSRLY